MFFRRNEGQYRETDRVTLASCGDVEFWSFQGA